MRLYFRRHMTAMVRLFGYAGLSIDEAKARLLPLREEFGDAKIADACEELLDIDHSRLPHMASLKRSVLALARALLGPPPDRTSGREVTSHPALNSLAIKCMTACPSKTPETASPTRQTAHQSTPAKEPVAGPSAKTRKKQSTRKSVRRQEKPR